MRIARTTAACLALVTTLLLNGRNAEAIVYHGPPDLHLAARLVAAGSDAKGFQSQVLFARLYGDEAKSEGRRLTQRYGADHIARFFPMLDYAVGDIVRLATTVAHAKIPPVSAHQNPTALQRDLIAAGTVPDGRYDVGYMIERLMTHPLHHRLMNDIDAKYGSENNAAFHEILASVVTGKTDGAAMQHTHH